MLINIDGKEIEALPGDTIMKAARKANIFIPGLCSSDFADGTNCCRLCMVEICEGKANKLVAACAFPVKDGLSVITNTQKILKIRRTLLELMYAQAPENPAIIKLMEYYEITPENKIPVKNEQCILCGLCVLACKKLGAAAISTVNRGINKEVNTPYGKSSESCIGCASCSLLCPTKCISVMDTDEGREIWNKNFNWVKCEKCGAIITTKEHYLASNEPGSPMLCTKCKQRAITDVFAETLGEAGSV